MRHAWPPFQALLEASAPTTYAVLLESDVPELVLAEEGAVRWLGVLSDHDAARRVSRWLYAPLSSVEERAIVSGVADLHDCFCKPAVRLVDVDEQGRVTGGTVDGRSVPDAALPDRCFTLPAWAAPAPVTSPRGTEAALARASRAGGIPLRVLAATLDAMQRLYHAIGLFLVEGRTNLAGPIAASIRERFDADLVAATSGSLVLSLVPRHDDEFQRATDTFAELVASAPERLDEVVERLGGRVRGRYEELLETLIDHDLHLLLSRPGRQGLFVASHIAERTLAAMPSAPPEASPSFFVRGVLVGFDPVKGDFSFYDPHRDEMLQGRISPTFAAPERITVGIKSQERVVRVVRRVIKTRGGTDISRYELHEVLDVPAAQAVIGSS